MRTHLLVQEGSRAKVASLMRSQWEAELAREGLPPVQFGAANPEELLCPACGASGPLAQGACSDCGLVLE